MRILVLSDSHGRESLLYEAILAQPQAGACFFLGDGERDFQAVLQYAQKVRSGCLKTVFQVRGNCDFSSLAPDCLLETVGGVRVFAAHGHLFSVKMEDAALLQEALRQRAAIALYGHTHQSVHRYVQGVHLFNPGSIAQRSYGVVDITPAGILCIPMQLP